MQSTMYFDNSIKSYRKFLAVKSLPSYRISGRVARFPAEYAGRMGISSSNAPDGNVMYEPASWLFDYQRDIARLAIEKRKFAVFADCGLGKTAIMLEYARHCLTALPGRKRILIVSPLMVIDQTITECRRFYGDSLPIEALPASQLQAWLARDCGEHRIGITNYEAIRDELRPRDLGALIIDESSLLKSHYGKWGTRLIELSSGLEYCLALTGTPAPNDRIEYANHAVFCGQFPNTTSFLARFFVNKGQTQERWVLRPHALRPFYRALSHWSIFLTNPATYGWRDNCQAMPPINVHIHDVDLTDEQTKLAGKESGQLFCTDLGGIVGRTKLAGLAKGWHKGDSVDTHKPQAVCTLATSEPNRSTLIWCLYNREQDELARRLPQAVNIDGRTSHDERMRGIERFKSGEAKILISKPKILGFGLNLQICTKQVFSSLQDSYESYYQAVKRSNRIGSTDPLDVHIPVTDLERPMVENVLRKAHRVHQDTVEQEACFKEFCECKTRYSD
jgi:superfamily II DNA or RNA helicase